MGGPSESRSARGIRCRLCAAWARAPFERAENRTAARLVDLWDARRARGAEPLFAPTIGAAIRAGRPWLAFYCPGCGVVGQIDLRRLDRHRDTPVKSLIPLVVHALLAASARSGRVASRCNAMTCARCEDTHWVCEEHPDKPMLQRRGRSVPRLQSAERRQGAGAAARLEN